MQRRCAEDDTKDDGGDNKAAIPDEVAVKADGRHADIMHGADGKAERRAADTGGPQVLGDKEPGRRECERDSERCESQARRIVHGIVGVEGEHGDEMRRPDAATGDDADAQNPECTALRSSFPRMSEKTDRRKTGKRTDKPGKNDKAQVVLDRYAIVNRQHAPRLEHAGA